MWPPVCCVATSSFKSASLSYETQIKNKRSLIFFRSLVTDNNGLFKESIIYFQKSRFLAVANTSWWLFNIEMISRLRCLMFCRTKTYSDASAPAFSLSLCRTRITAMIATNDPIVPKNKIGCTRTIRKHCVRNNGIGKRSTNHINEAFRGHSRNQQSIPSINAMTEASIE